LFGTKFSDVKVYDPNKETESGVSTKVIMNMIETINSQLQKNQ